MSRQLVRDSCKFDKKASVRSKRSVQTYNLDVVLAVSYRVRSPRAVQFWQWGDYGAAGIPGEGTRRALEAAEADREAAEELAAIEAQARRLAGEAP